MTMTFIISDSNFESHALEIRQGTAGFREKIPQNHNVSLVMKRKVLDEILLSQSTLQQAIPSGNAKIQKGNLEQIQVFYFI